MHPCHGSIERLPLLTLESFVSGWHPLRPLAYTCWISSYGFVESIQNIVSQNGHSTPNLCVWICSLLYMYTWILVWNRCLHLDSYTEHISLFSSACTSYFYVTDGYRLYLCVQYCSWNILLYTNCIGYLFKYSDMPTGHITM